MKAYSNKSDKTNSQKCLYSEINASNKARKVANRREAKKLIITHIE